MALRPSIREDDRAELNCKFRLRSPENLPLNRRKYDAAPGPRKRQENEFDLLPKRSSSIRKSIRKFFNIGHQNAPKTAASYWPALSAVGAIWYQRNNLEIKHEEIAFRTTNLQKSR